MTLDTIRQAVTATGLILRGAFHPETGDKVPAMPSGEPVGTLVLLGFSGGQGWASFARSPEFGDGAPDPLDRWSRRIVGTLAAGLEAVAFYPFGGPPFLPFIAWAQRAEPVYPSPIGMLIHPDWGLWHSYRGALGFAARLVLPVPDHRVSPCESCSTRPCLTSCPVGAFTPGRYDVAGCAAHLGTVGGADCLGSGCRARRACPIGRTVQYEPAQAVFHMQAFRGARRG
jgi:hypothetical protein